MSNFAVMRQPLPVTEASSLLEMVQWGRCSTFHDFIVVFMPW